MSKYWKSQAISVIKKVTKNYFLEKGYKSNKQLSKDELKDLKSLISKAYPFGQRHYYPYHVWLKEVKAQMRYLKGLPPLNLKSAKTRLKNAPIPPGQLSLFD